MKRDLETLAWAALLIWLGVRNLLPFLPNGTGALGIGLILLGLNAVRAHYGIPVKPFTSLLGWLALAWGATELANDLWTLPFKIPAFAIVLVILGVFLLVQELRRAGATRAEVPG